MWIQAAEFLSRVSRCLILVFDFQDLLRSWIVAFWIQCSTFSVEVGCSMTLPRRLLGPGYHVFSPIRKF